MQAESKTIPIQQINDSVTEKHNVKLYVLRTDLNHPLISGNKLFKLKYNLIEARKQNKKTILTFGGAYSNHIAATAAAGKEYGFKTIGIIRGEKMKDLNPTLKFASECGMELNYVSRTLFKNKNELQKFVATEFGESNYYLVPEGGSNELGLKGCSEIPQFITIDFETICVPCGTGITMAGIVTSIKPTQKVIGFQILKGENYIRNEVETWITKTKDKPNLPFNNWEVNEVFHFGGYAKVNKELKDFIHQFEISNKIPLDYIYTGKMMYGIYELIKNGFFKQGQSIIAVHTGGLQGNAGFEKS